MRLEAKAQWQRHSLIEVSDEAPSGTGLRQEGTTFDLLLNTASADVLLHHGGRRGVTGTLGASAVYQVNDSRGPIALVPDAGIGSAAGFAFEQVNVGHWSLLAGGRIDRRHLRADANPSLALSSQVRDYTAWSGDLGLVFRPFEGLAMTANAGRAWRAPNLFELFANGPHLGEARYEMGTAGLVPEAATNLDLGMRWEARRVRGEAAVYRNAVARYIYVSPSAVFRDSLRVYQYLQADALLTGGEVSVEFELWRPLTLRASAEAVRGANQTTAEPLPLMPPPRFVLGGEVRPPGQARVYAGAEVEVVARPTRLNPLDLPTNGYTLLNLSAGLERRWASRPLRLDLMVRNAANASYRDFLSRYKEFALNPGRNIALRVSFMP